MDDLARLIYEAAQTAAARAAEQRKQNAAAAGRVPRPPAPKLAPKLGPAPPPPRPAPPPPKRPLQPALPSLEAIDASYRELVMPLVAPGTVSADATAAKRSAVVQAMLSNPGTLAAALVASEILGAPLSLRPGGAHRDPS